MKIITLEEHFAEPALMAASAPVMRELAPNFAAAYSPEIDGSWPSMETLRDIGDSRIADMDTCGISKQVLSCLWAQQAPADLAPDLVRAVNNTAADAVRAHPDRFAAFAALPTAAPAEAARELERCVSELGFVGTLVNGRTGTDFLDAPRFDPVLAVAARLQVPIYLHPAPPTVATTESNYSGLDPLVTARLQTAAWGWHVETATHLIHLVLSGVFDRYPDLCVILGHWGEMIPFYLDRLDELLPPEITKLERRFGDYFRHNVYITPSGMFSQAQLQFCVEALGADRILCAVDYPFVRNDGVVPFLEEARLDEKAKRQIAHENAEKLLGV